MFIKFVYATRDRRIVKRARSISARPQLSIPTNKPVEIRVSTLSHRPPLLPVSFFRCLALLATNLEITNYILIASSPRASTSHRNDAKDSVF